jgi:hypothetical protein
MFCYRADDPGRNGIKATTDNAPHGRNCPPSIDRPSLSEFRDQTEAYRCIDAHENIP